MRLANLFASRSGVGNWTNRTLLTKAPTPTPPLKERGFRRRKTMKNHLKNHLKNHNNLPGFRADIETA